MKRLAIIALALAVGACASTQRTFSYGRGADARIDVDGKPMMLHLHPRDDAVMAEVTLTDAAVGGLVQGFTLGMVQADRPNPNSVNREMARFIAPSGCSFAPVRPLGGEGVAFETSFTCPSGVSLRDLMAAQRDALLEGRPLQAD